MKKLFLPLIVFSLLALTACQLNKVTEKKAARTAEQWAEAFFQADYQEAQQYVTPESQRWLQFAASNITQHDLDLLNAADINVEVEDILPSDNDSLVKAIINVSNYVAPALLGQESSIQQEGVFSVILVEQDGKWRVRMEGLPQNERQSRVSD